jgi:hypothetical protein
MEDVFLDTFKTVLEAETSQKTNGLSAKKIKIPSLHFASVRPR